MNNSTIIGFPFVGHVDQSARPEIDINYLISAYTKLHSQLDNLQRFGVVKIMGYKYDFKPYLKKYVYKQYGHWFEVYAPNKTTLRKSVFGRIDKITSL